MMCSPHSACSKEMNDSDVLQILLKLVDGCEVEWEPQFPFLDISTVNRVSKSISNTFVKGNQTLQRNLMPLVRKWCTGRSQSNNLNHSAWIGRSLSVRDTVESALSVCIPLIKDGKEWMRREEEQQLAVCYAMLGAATNMPAPLHTEAKDTCILLVSRILNQRELSVYHHRFLAQFWNSVGEFPIKTDILVRMAERSFLGIERTILWLGRRSLRNEMQTIEESFETILGSTLLKISSQSSVIFQSVCDILTHMMVVSEAHPGIQALTKFFILGVEKCCACDGRDISVLYEDSCQLLSALLCVDPNFLPPHGKNKLSRETILEMLSALPREKAACLLAHRPIWLLFTF